MARIAVVGAGAVGLSTAVQIQDLLPYAKMTLIADKFTSETTSNGAAGIFNPTLAKTPGVPLPLLKSVLIYFQFFRHEFYIYIIMMKLVYCQ